MKVVFGLGNPDRRYERTRHNVGYRVVDELAARAGEPFASSRFSAAVADISEPVRTLLVKPTTYMNLSGRAVNAVVSFYDVPLDDVLVVCDDIDLELGVLRMRVKGGSGGQNGLKSITEQLGTDEFPRLRIGIGRDEQMDPSDYVLGRFTPEQTETIEHAIDRAADAATRWLADGIVTAMNEYNG